MNNKILLKKPRRRLQEPPVLHLPNNKGRFHLNPDTRMYATGSAFIKRKMVDQN